jgi:hypothetical protein
MCYANKVNELHDAKYTEIRYLASAYDCRVDFVAECPA